MVDIDLDERRKLKKAKTLKANGHTYKLPVYMPATTMQAMFALANARKDPGAAVEAVRLAYGALFGQDNLDQAMADFSLADFEAITEEVYRVKPGEAAASRVSSRNTGTRPRRTSSASTTST